MSPFEIYGTSATSLVQRSTSVYFAEHKFDRCQTCFCLIRAASVPMFKRRYRLNLQVLPKAKHCYCKSSTYQNGQGCPWFHTSAMFLLCKNSPPANVHGCTFAGKVSVPPRMASVFCTLLSLIIFKKVDFGC